MDNRLASLAPYAAACLPVLLLSLPHDWRFAPLHAAVVAPACALLFGLYGHGLLHLPRSGPEVLLNPGGVLHDGGEIHYDIVVSTLFSRSCRRRRTRHGCCGPPSASAPLAPPSPGRAAPALLRRKVVEWIGAVICFRLKARHGATPGNINDWASREGFGREKKGKPQGEVLG